MLLDTPPGKRPRINSARKQSGVALPLVVVTIVLASTLVVAVTYSTYLSGRLNASLEQGLKAEYLVKSALNLARVLIAADKESFDSPNAPWAIFEGGAAVPIGLLGISEPNVKLELEITSLSKRLSTGCLYNNFTNPNSADLVFKRLFENIGFANDKEEDQSGRFPGKIFSPEEMVGNLRDYTDDDSTSYNLSPFVGVESQLPAGTFPNRKLLRDTEFAAIPGFTPKRFQQLLPYIVVNSICEVNFNSADPIVMRSLDARITDSDIDGILQMRVPPNGPIDNKNNIIFSDSAVFSGIGQFITIKSKSFNVVAKAQFSANTTFLRAHLKANASSSSGLLPRIELFELY